MNFKPEELAAMGRLICETMLQLPADAGALSDDGGPRRAWTRISGAWDGVVAIECPAIVARRAASVMFGVEPNDASPDDLHDSVLELANVVGGNIKGLLPEPCRLSLPQACEGELRDAFPSMRELSAFDVPSDGFPMRVTIFAAAA